MSLNGKVAIITGGWTRIRKSLCKRLVQNGIKVVIADINEEKGDYAEEIRHRGYEALAIKVDISDESVHKTWRKK